MEKVLGFGGLFFRATDPDALAAWYADVLGIAPVPGEDGGETWVQERGPTAFQPFPRDSAFFGAPSIQFMMNFRVADLDAMVEQIRAAGTPVEVDPEAYSYGRFASLADPEGNPIQLWEDSDKA